MKQLLHSAKSLLLGLLILAGSVASAQPFVEVLQPQLGDTWVIGTSKLISWNTNFTQPVKIDLVDYTNPLLPVVTPIVASTVNSTYSWLIDGGTFVAGTQYKVKVTSTVTSMYSDESDFFTLAASAPGTYVSLEQPNVSGINWLNNSTYLISWDSDLGGTFKIELLKAGLSVATIAAAAHMSTYEWTIGGAVEAGNDYKIKITSNNDPSKSDVSEQFFTISYSPTGATITVLQPSDAGITLVRGSDYLISWIDNVPEVLDIELYSTEPFTLATDDADNYGGLWADGDNEGSGFEAWDITTHTDGIAGVASAFIGDPALGGIVGMSDPAFGVVAYSNPTSNDNYVYADRELSDALEPGSTLSLDWAFHWATGFAGGDKGIVLYGGGVGGTELIRIHVENDVAPITINGSTMFSNFGNNAMDLSFELIDDVTLRVSGTGRDGLETYTHDFTIAVAPDALRFYSVAQSDAGYLNRAVYFNNLRVTRHTMIIAEDVVGSTYVWSIPGSLSTSASYRVIVKDQSEEITDESDNFFHLSANPAGTTVTVLQPDELGLTLVKGTSYLISWIDNIPGPVDIYLSGTQIANDVVGSTWVWDIPGALANGSYFIRVQAANNSGVFDVGQNFTISGYPAGGTIEVLQPNVPGIVWLSNQSYLISWTSNFATGPVNIELWKGAAKTADLATNYSGSTYVWDLSAGVYVLGTDYSIKVTAMGGSVSDESDNDFEISETPGGTVEVLQPNGGETLYAGQGYLIAWIDNVPEPMRIILYDDLNVTTTVLANNVIGSTWVWDIPLGFTAHSQYRIRVRSIYSDLIGDFSDGQFTISPLPMTFSLYPNPAKDFVTVKFDELANSSFTLQISDRFNTVVLSKVVNAEAMKEYRISTDELPNGIYFLTITSDNFRSVQKVMVQRF